MPLVALEETGHPYELRLVDLAAAGKRTADYLAISSKAKVPQLDWIDGRVAPGWRYGEHWSLVDVHLG